MRAQLLAIVLVAACGGKAKTETATPAPAAPPAAETPIPESSDPRAIQLRTMTTLLAKLADQVAAITAAKGPSTARCEELTALLLAWGEEHYPAYEEADGEGTYLGLHADDTDDPVLRALAVELARDSSVVIEVVDDDCLYGSGGYGDALYEYLIGYQGLEHWVQDGDPDAWAYETLIAE